jgi:hypothetical protein
MATRTLGTTANNSLTALSYLAGIGSMPAADVALVDLIKNDLSNGHELIPGAFQQNGQLYIPNRGWLQIRPGDYVAIDSQGWPILVSANSIANAAWTHS